MNKKLLLFLVIFNFLYICSFSNQDFYQFIHNEGRELYTTYGKETATVSERNIEYIGKQHKFWAMEPLTFKFYELEATLKAIGKHCYIYVENSQNIDENIIRKFINEFDNNIYPTTTRYFGSESKPGIDNDEKITMLFFDIKDGYVPGKTGFIAGYYLPQNEYTKAKYQYSNEREMIYIDTYPADPASEFSLSVIAHEFQHMIHWNNDPEEDLWLNEAMSQLAIKLCGYNHPGQIYKYSKNPELSLVQFHPEYMVENYGITYLYVYNILLNYFKNNPVDFTFNLVRDPKKGLESIENIMSKFNHNIKSRELFNNFALKNIINTPETDFYYEKSLDDFLIIPLKQNDFSNSLKMDRVVSFGADYIRFVQDNSFNSVNFDFVGVKESAWAYFPDYVEYGIYAVTYFDFDKKNTLNIDRLRLDSDNEGSFTFDKFGLEYNTVDLVITNTTKNESVAYRYKASKKTVSRENSKLEKAKNMLSPYIKNTFENKNINGYNNYLKLFEKINTDIEKNQIESVLY